MVNNDVKSLAEDLLASLSKQRSHGEFCDVQLTNGISKVWSHSCVLATVSPFILRYFVANLERTTEWSVQKPIQINISTLTKCKGESKNNCIECVADTIEFIYTGKIKLKENHLDHILNLSSNLELENLLSICRKFKKDSTKIEPYDFACENCGYRSENEEQFLIHDMIFHRDSYTCLSCNFEDHSISKIVDHTSNCNSLICPICLFYAENNLILNQHVEEHKDFEPFICSRCSCRFQERKEWLRHFSICQKTIKSCPVCNFSFPDDIIYKKHVKVFHKNKYTCLSCEYNTFKMDRIVNHLKISDHLELFCSVCLQESSSKTELNAHLDEHLGKLPFKCKPCRISYPNRRQWWRHMSSHYDEKPFSCSHCHLKFKNKVHLNTHRLRIHKKKTYICPVCGLAAPFPSLLEKHQKSHLIKKQEYACLKCDFKSKYKNHFLKHKKEHKDPPKRDKKNLQCSICKIYFSLEKNLNRHMKFQHNSLAYQYKCPKCNYVSVRLDKIKDHCVKVHCMDEVSSSAVTKSLKVTVPVKPLVTKDREYRDLKPEQDKNTESHQKALERLEDESAKVVQLCIQENGQVIVENIEEKTSGNRRHLEMGEDGSIILKDIEQRQNKNYTELNMEELESSVIRELTNRQDYSYMGEDGSQKDNSVRLDEQVKKTLFLNQSTGEINIISSSQGAIPIANVTATNYLTIGNFREGTGSVTLNETTGVLTFNNINSGSTGAVFLNESTGELSYIELNQNASEERFTQPEYKEIEQTQLDEVTGEIVKVNNKTEEISDDIFDFDMDYFNEDSFDGFDDFDELLFDNVGTDSESEHPGGYNEIQKFMIPGSQTPRLDEMTGELTFAESHSSSQNLWNEFKSFTENAEDNNSSYNSFLDEITGEFYK